MSGNAFAASGSSSGSVVNQGIITSNTGDAILVGQSVTNNGTISAPNGTVGLAAGNEILLQPVGSDARIAISGGSGSVTNSGTLRAAQVELNSAGGNVYALVENNGGVISATGTKTVGGHVWLTAGGTATITGARFLIGENANGAGGARHCARKHILSGRSMQVGDNHRHRRSFTIVASNTTAVTGSIKCARRRERRRRRHRNLGSQLAIDGAKSTRDKAATGCSIPQSDRRQRRCLDHRHSLNAGTSVTLQTTASGTSGPGTPNASGNGDIYINSAIDWGTSATLTLDAYHSIFVNAPITVTAAGGVVLKTNDGGTGGDYSFGLGPTGFAGSINYGSTNNGGTLTINGTAYTLLYSMSEVQNIDSNLGGNYALSEFARCEQ